MAAASPKKAAGQENLRKVFDQYSAFGLGNGVQKDKADGIEGRNYFKLMNECGLVHAKALSRTDVDLIFTKHKPKGGARKLDFDQFCASLVDIAKKRFPKTFQEKGEEAAVNQTIAKLTSVEGPGLAEGVSVPGEVRLHDDKESYTGVYKRGGPGAPSEGSGVTLEKLLDRTPADARGRHK